MTDALVKIYTKPVNEIVFYTIVPCAIPGDSESGYRIVIRRRMADVN